VSLEQRIKNERYILESLNTIFKIPCDPTILDKAAKLRAGVPVDEVFPLLPPLKRSRRLWFEEIEGHAVCFFKRLGVTKASANGITCEMEGRTPEQARQRITAALRIAMTDYGEGDGKSRRGRPAWREEIEGHAVCFVRQDGAIHAMALDITCQMQGRTPAEARHRITAALQLYPVAKGKAMTSRDNPSLLQRFMRALPPISDRAMVLFLLVAVFACGMMAGFAVTTHRLATEADRRVIQVEVPPSSRSTVHQRLDALEQRMQALEQRQIPSP
jgi:predicted RNase H-like HicB family nuclease